MAAEKRGGGTTRSGAYVSALGATLLWGTQGPVAKVLVTEATFLPLAALRGVAAATLLLAIVGGQSGWKALALPRDDLLRVVGVGVIGLCLGQIAWLYALIHVPVSVTVLLTNTSPVYIALLAVLWLGEPLRRDMVLGMLLSFAGVALLVLRGGGPTGVLDLGGVAAGLLSGLAWAVFTVGGRSLVARYEPTRAVALAAGVGAVCLVPLALLLSPWTALAGMPRVLAGGLYLGVVPVAIGYVLWYGALRRLRAAQAAAFQYLVPVWTVAIAAVWLGEPLTPPLAGGMVLVIAGVWLVQRR